MMKKSNIKIISASKIMTKEMNIKISYGIHLIIDLHHILQNYLENNTNSKVNVQIDLDAFKKGRNDVDESYFNDYILLVKEILNINNVTINLGQNYGYFGVDDPVGFIERHKIYIRKNNYFTKYQINNISIPIKKYICINTKIVNSSLYFNGDLNPKYNFINKYHLIKKNLFEILNNSNYNIVLLGERNIPECNEYNFHRDNYGNYVFYNDLIENLNNYTDETYNDSKDGYNLMNFKKTCYYLTHSKLNIFIGNGGGIHLYATFENSVQLGVTDRLLSWIYPENIETKFESIIDTDIFLDSITNKLN